MARDTARHERRDPHPVGDRAGRPEGGGQLLPLVYDELRKLAAARLADEKPGQTLQSTALVHEAYLRLVGDGQPADWDGRGHFFAAAAEAMRRILIDRARRKATAKRGGGLRRIDIEHVSAADDGREAELLALDDALTELERHDPQAARAGQAAVLRRAEPPAGGAGPRGQPAGRRPALGPARAWLYQRLSAE